MKTRERQTQTWTTQKSVQNEPRKYLIKKQIGDNKHIAEAAIYFKTKTM